MNVVMTMNILMDVPVQCELFIHWYRSAFLSISHMCISMSEEGKTNTRMFGRGGIIERGSKGK